MADVESGFISDPELEFGIHTDFSDVEIIRVSKINVIAKGRRYGRLWLLKGLRKEIQTSPTYRRQLQKEFEIHSRLHNPAVVQSVGVEEIPELGVCIVEEWIEGKTLSQLLREGKLTKNERCKILREVIQATGYLHSMGVIHRDLKPANIMVRNAGKSVSLIDFGLADTDDYVELKQAAGTAGFISPEQEKEEKAAVSDDIYSLGAIMKQLTPEYASIARRCTGNLNKRPKNTEDLLKLLDRRDRLPKIVWSSAAIAALIILAFLTFFHISNLSRSAEEAKATIAATQNAAVDAQEKVRQLTETNRLQQTRMEQLTDSLNDVTVKMTSAQAELDKTAAYELVKNRALNEGYRQIDALISHYDKKVFPNLIETIERPRYIQEFTDVNEKGKAIADAAADSKKFPELTSQDRERIKTDVYNYLIQQLVSYQKKWRAMVHPNQSN